MFGWGEFAGAFGLFLVSHALPARPRLRRRLAGVLGERGYLALYSLLSVAALTWLVVAAGRAPYVPLWDAAPWQWWVPNLAMPLACLLVAFGLGASNPPSRCRATRLPCFGMATRPTPACSPQSVARLAASACPATSSGKMRREVLSLTR